MFPYNGARILIFGGTGSLGKKLISRLGPRSQVHVFSRDEAKHWTIRNEIMDETYAKNVSFHVGDIRDQARVLDVIAMVQPQVIIIAAALKQVDTCERTPSESVLTNIIGTQNVVNAVHSISRHTDSKISKVLFVSTDKACAPVNVYGMCKAISERIVTAQPTANGQLEFVATRYGNVMESRGSIIPLFKYQVEHQKHITVTDPDMTRFLMTLDQSVDLIVATLSKAKSGEIWVPKLPAMRIGDLAEIFSDKFNKPIKVIGLRPGEKQHEDLINESESSRTRTTKDHHIIEPAHTCGNRKRFTYASNDNALSKEELHSYLEKSGIIDWPLEKFTGRNIEEIVKGAK